MLRFCAIPAYIRHIRHRTVPLAPAAMTFYDCCTGGLVSAQSGSGLRHGVQASQASLIREGIVISVGLSGERCGTTLASH